MVIKPAHKVPQKRWRLWRKDGPPDEGIFQIPYQMFMRDPETDKIVEPDGFACRYFKLVAKRKKSGVWDRLWDDLRSLDGYSYGPAHFWSDTFPEILAGIAKRHPNLTIWAFGPDVGRAVRDPAWLRSFFPVRRLYHKKSDWRDDWDVLWAGLYEISRHPVWQREIAAHLLEKAQYALKLCKSLGFQSEYAVAALARFANSRGEGGMHHAVTTLIKELGDGVDERTLVHTLYARHGYQKRLSRLDVYFSWDRKRPRSISADELDYDAATPLRLDGTMPRWYELGLDILNEEHDPFDYPLDGDPPGEPVLDVDSHDALREAFEAAEEAAEDALQSSDSMVRAALEHGLAEARKYLIEGGHG